MAPLMSPNVLGFLRPSSLSPFRRSTVGKRYSSDPAGRDTFLESYLGSRSAGRLIRGFGRFVDRRTVAGAERRKPRPGHAPACTPVRGCATVRRGCATVGPGFATVRHGFATVRHAFTAFDLVLPPLKPGHRSRTYPSVSVVTATGKDGTLFPFFFLGQAERQGGPC